MTNTTIVTRVFWGMGSAGCLFGFLHDPQSVAWFVALLSSLIPFVASLFLGDDRWDRGFLSILIYTLDGVALGIASAHFVMFAAHPWSLSLIPLFSGVAWWIHERKMAQ